MKTFLRLCTLSQAAQRFPNPTHLSRRCLLRRNAPAIGPGAIPVLESPNALVFFFMHHLSAQIPKAATMPSCARVPSAPSSSVPVAGCAAQVRKPGRAGSHAVLATSYSADSR